MTVKELREKLSKFSDDTEVFIYCEIDEADAPALFVDEVSLLEEKDEYTKEIYKISPFYCRGDSFVEEYLNDKPEGEKVIVIHNDPFGCNERI